MPNIYSQPEAYGLETVGEVQWSHPGYDHDVTVIFRDVVTGRLYVGEDQGCSCDVAFDGKGRDKLTPVDLSQTLIDVLLNKRKDVRPEAQVQAADLVHKARTEFQAWRVNQGHTTCERHELPAKPKVTPEVAAHVLFCMDQVVAEWGEPRLLPPGDWTHSLITVMDRADRTRFAKLREAFPDYGEALHMYKYTETGHAELRQIATGKG